MEPVITAALASTKALLLVASAALVVALLKGGPARLRAIVLGTALIGTLVIPLASVLMPELPVPLPIESGAALMADDGMRLGGTDRIRWRRTCPTPPRYRAPALRRPHSTT